VSSLVTMLRPRLPRLAASLRRSLHNVPRIAHTEDGIPGLYTPQGIYVAWTEYQGLMIDKLNALTAGMYNSLRKI
jgi:superoxide dismutase, Fe-Mn family